MKPALIALILTFAIVKDCRSQQVSVIAVQVIGVDSSQGFPWQYEFYYPYIVCSNNAVQDSLNEALLSNISPDSIGGLDSNSMKHYLREAVGNGFTYLSFETVFSSSGLLGLDVFGEATAAYPTSWWTHYLFNINTGHQYYLEEIIAQSNKQKFARHVLAAMKDSINGYTIEIAREVEMRQRDTGDLADVKYFLDECVQSMSEESVLSNTDFYFKNDSLFIESPCEFPHVVRALEPIFQIPYPAKSIKEFLVPEIYQQLISEKRKK